MSEFICIHCYVSGKVQGVWFRASAQDEAKRLNITGWAKNLADGRVEVVAYGEKTAISKFYAWLKKGPRLAQVTECTYELFPAEEFAQFEIR